MDALTTMKLLQYYLWCRKFSIPLYHSKVAVLGQTPITPSFAKRHPTFEGVTMQSKKYKGVPYITANPNRQRYGTPRSSKSDTPLQTKSSDTNGQEGFDNTTTQSTTTSISNTNTNTNTNTNVSTNSDQTPNGQAMPIDPPPSTDAAAIV